MKFFVFFALVAMASALNYNLNGQSLLVGGKAAYGNLLSTGSSYGSGSYGSGLRLAGGYGGLTGYSGLSRASYAAPAYSQGLVLAKAVPVAKFGYAPVQGYAQASYQSQGPITAAIHSQRSVEVVDVPSTPSYAAPQSIIIGPSVQPVDIEFQSQSSPVTVRQSHIPGTPSAPQYSSHQEEPDLLKQEIVKPVVHEVTEAIQPFRKITQEVRPVQETIQQIVTRGQQQQQQYAYAAAPVQASYAAVQPVQTVAVQPIQASYVAQPTLAYAAAPAYSSGYTSGYTSGLSNFAAKPSLALTGSSFVSKPALSLSTSEVSGADAY